MTKATPLAERIENFLRNHGKKDAEGEDWNGPDPSELEAAAQLIRAGLKPDPPFSQWGSGCYHPYNDKFAQKEHEEILQEIKDFQP